MRTSRRYPAFCLLLLLWGGAAASAFAQAADSAQAASAQAFAEGVEAVQRGAYAQAVPLLAELVRQAPGYVDPQHGAAAYWLGRAYQAQGDAPAMRAAWRNGLDALRQAGRFDVRLGDASLPALAASGQRDDVQLAVWIYLNLLASLDADLLPEERALVNRHLAHLALILPAPVRRRLMRGEADAPAEGWSMREDAGHLLVAWWRSQDPLPATRHNERLEEHLERVAFAGQHYAYAERPTGLDERGEVYVRYGKPDRQLSVSFNSPEIEEVFQPGVTVSLSDFPGNEFWLYGHIDRAAYYLFVEDRGTYRVGTTEDLIPRPLRYGFTSGRGTQKAVMLVAVLQTIYRQLGPLHPDFAPRYSEVEDYADQIAYARRFGGSGSLNTQAQPPSVFAEGFLVRSQSEDDQAYGRREQYVPRQYTEVFREEEILPVAVRTARFLDDDGTTRTEIYWSPEPGALMPSKKQREQLEEEGYGAFEAYLLRLTTVQKTAQYEDRVVNLTHYFIDELPTRGEAAIPVQQAVVRGDTGLYHLALEWDQHLPGRRRSDARTMTLGPRVKVATHRVDSLRALDADAAALEMSDLRPTYVLGEVTDPDAFDRAAAPYPFSVITPEISLGLYFEAYHLAFGSDDRTHFEIAYEVRRSGASSLLRFLGGRGDEITSARSTYTGASRTARESILLDLSEWQGRGELEVVVRLTDLTTGRQVARSLRLELSS